MSQRFVEVGQGKHSRPTLLCCHCGTFFHAVYHLVGRTRFVPACKGCTRKILALLPDERLENTVIVQISASRKHCFGLIEREQEHRAHERKTQEATDDVE